MQKYDTFAQFKEITQKNRAEKEKELGYTMLDTNKGRDVCIRQIERKIEQVIDE
ncbi:MAG TPA: hypothetical protein VFC74_01910 [Oscillospiraceae bacterium]|nr:hypothetical protein [Oscillospiraceae bacterium]